MNNLINKYQNGEQEVFGEILKKYNNLLYKVINKYPTNVLYAKEDKYQMALMSLVKAIKTFDTTKNIQFTTYLTRIVTNDMNTTFRYVQKRDSGEIETLDKDISKNGENFTIMDTLTNGNNVDDYMEKQCENEFIQECLHEYKKKYFKKYESVVLVLQGLTHREVAKYVSYGRTQVGKNYNHFLEFVQQKAKKEGLINN